MSDNNHWHCTDGCERGAGDMTKPLLNGFECFDCGAPFLPCTPEICHKQDNMNE